MNMSRLLPLLTTVIALSGCSDSGSEPSPQCPACAAGMICDPQTGTCVPEAQDCGPNTTASGGCACLPGWLDCDQNVGTAGGNGCECSGVCNGASCDTGTAPECSPQVTGDCGDSARFCSGGQCASCPSGTYNCDGLEACECTGGCDGATCKTTTPPDCSPQIPDDCGGPSQMCTAGQCAPCPEGLVNCDGIGECECEGVCDEDACEDYAAQPCVQLAASYGDALAEARQCDPTASPDPCTYVITSDISCGCEVWVNASNTAAIDTMDHIKAAAQSKGCTYSCPPTGCAGYTSSSCEAQAGGGGRCEYQ